MTSASVTAAPPLPYFALRRPHLLAQIDAGVRGKLTQVAAPPGYGKTFLLAQWAAEHSREQLAWLSLDNTNDHAVRLARRLVRALEGLQPDLGRSALDRLDDAGLELNGAFVEQLLVELTGLREAVLVIDGLGAVSSPALVEALTALIEHAPPTFHIVISGRSTSLLPTEGLGVSEEVMSLETRDLAFRADEAGTLLRNVSGRRLDDRQVEVLVDRTEGWPAGLQLAAVALRAERDVAGFVERFAGDDQHVAAYLTQEVLARQPPYVRRFLLETSVLHQLSEPVSDYITGGSSSVETLALLELGGVFVQRLSPGRFRYHGLFRDLLRHELRARDPDAEPRLLRRAAEWHLANDEVELAVTHLIEAEDWERVLDLVDRHAYAMHVAGDTAVVVRWLEAVPAGLRSSRRMALQRAMVHAQIGNYHVADQVLVDLEARSMSSGEQLVANMLRASGVQWHVPPAQAISAADAVLEALPTLAPDEIPDIFGVTSPVALRHAASGSRAKALWLVGEVEEARDALISLIAEEEPSSPYNVHIVGYLALLEAWAGCLVLAEQQAAKAMQIAAETGRADNPSTIDAYLAMATVFRERDHLGRAALVLDEAVARASRVRRTTALAIGAGERALLHLANGQPERGLHEIRDHGEGSSAARQSALDARLRAIEVRLLVAMGDLDRADAILEGRSTPWSSELAAAALQLAIARHDVGAARGVLEQWPAGGELRSCLARDMWTAVVQGLEGHRRRSLDLLRSVVSVAEPEGHVRLFLDEGEPVMRLLRALANEQPTDYLRTLVDQATNSESSERSAEHADQLSDREMQVLRFLPTRLSGAEIAGGLYVSLNTLKTHLRSIYRKLEVSGRREAIEAAERRGLL